jgi:hypothetical protein
MVSCQDKVHFIQAIFVSLELKEDIGQELCIQLQGLILLFLQGMLSKEAQLALIESIKDGRLTLDQYLFGSQDDHCLCLPLSLDELLMETLMWSVNQYAVYMPNLSYSHLTMPIERAIFSASNAHPRDFANGIRGDLDRAIWSYEQALSLLPKGHYRYLETLLGLCSSIYQRFYLLRRADDLKNLRRYLDLQHDELNQKDSVLALVQKTWSRSIC